MSESTNKPEQRESGWYWVKWRTSTLAVEWNGSNWLIGVYRLLDHNLQEIDERPITRKPEGEEKTQKLIHQLFIVKVSEIIGIEKTGELLKDSIDSFEKYRGKSIVEIIKKSINDLSNPSSESVKEK